MASVIRTLAYSALVVSAAGAIRVTAQLAVNRAGKRLSAPAVDLLWRIAGVKVAGIAIVVISLTASGVR